MRPPPAGGPHGNDGLFRRIWYAHAGPEPGILCTEMKRETGISVIGGLLKHTAGLSPASGRGDSETARSACGRPDCPRVTSLVACSSGANRNVEPTARLGSGHVRSTAGQSPPRPQWCAPRPLTAGLLRPTAPDCVPSAGTGRRGSWDRLSCNETARPWNLLVGTHRQSQSLLRRGGDIPALQTLPPLHSYQRAWNEPRNYRPESSRSVNEGIIAGHSAWVPARVDKRWTRERDPRDEGTGPTPGRSSRSSHVHHCTSTTRQLRYPPGLALLRAWSFA